MPRAVQVSLTSVPRGSKDLQHPCPAESKMNPHLLSETVQGFKCKVSNKVAPFDITASKEVGHTRQVRRRWRDLSFVVNNKSFGENQPSKAKESKIALEAEVKLYGMLATKLETAQRWLIDPRSKFMRTWDNFIMILLFFMATVTPFETAFQEPSADMNLLWAINRLVDSAFLIDIFVNCCLRYYEGGKLGKDHYMILYRYAKGFMALDVISAIPFDIISHAANASISLKRFMRLLRLLKLARLLRAVRIIDRVRLRMSMSNASFTLMMCFFTSITTVHWAACLWRLVPSIEGATSHYPQRSWLHEYRVTRYDGIGSPVGDASLFTLYCYCVEFGLQSMVMTFSSVQPTTTFERVMAIVIMLFSGGLYAYVIGTVCSVISNIDPATTAYRNTSDMLRLFCAEVKIPGDQQSSLMAYYQQCGELFPYRYYQRTLQDLSPQMQSMIAIWSFKDFIQHIKVFMDAGDREQGILSRAVALHLVPAVYAPRECIFMKGQVASRFYIIQKGIATIGGRIMHRTASFGIDCFLIQTERPVYQESVYALSYLHVFFLNRSAISDILGAGNLPNTAAAVRSFSVRRSMRIFCRKVCILNRVCHPKQSLARERMLSKYLKLVREVARKKARARKLAARDISKSSIETLGTRGHRGTTDKLNGLINQFAVRGGRITQAEQMLRAKRELEAITGTSLEGSALSTPVKKITKTASSNRTSSGWESPVPVLAHQGGSAPSSFEAAATSSALGMLEPHVVTIMPKALTMLQDEMRGIRLQLKQNMKFMQSLETKLLGPSRNNHPGSSGSADLFV